MGPALGASLHARLSCRRPPLDFVTICCSLVPKLRPTRLDYIDFVILSSCSYVLLYSFAWSFVLLFSGSQVSCHSFILFFFVCVLVLLCLLLSCSLVLSEETSWGLKPPHLAWLACHVSPWSLVFVICDPLFSRSSVLCFRFLLSLCHRVFFLCCSLAYFVVLLSCSLVLYK